MTRLRSAQRPPTLTAVRDEYLRLWVTCKIRPERRRQVDAIVDKLVANRRRYAAIKARTGVPWWFTAVIHSMETGIRFDCHLHNGDPLTARTVHVPAGRPRTGRPPFSFAQSAVDALRYDGLDKWKDWGVAGSLYKLEGYNGWRSRLLHGIHTPYLWSFSRHYTKGKYVADNVWDPNAVSQQCGAAVLLRRMVDREIVKTLGKPRDS